MKVNASQADGLGDFLDRLTSLCQETCWFPVSGTQIFAGTPDGVDPEEGYLRLAYDQEGRRFQVEME